MKIGVLGGTFDPVHKGHIALAKSAFEEISLSKVIFVPNRVQPFKLGQKISSAHDRMKMLQMAIKDLPWAEISTYELEKETISYTFETLDFLKKEYEGCELFFILGTDSFLTIKGWKNSEYLLQNFNFIIGMRPGYKEEDSQRLIEGLREQYGSKLIPLNNSLYDISSSRIRFLMAIEKNAKDMIGEDIQDYIRDKDLYSLESLLDEIAPQYDEGRRAHVLGVIETADFLARKYGTDPVKTKIAALFHDLYRGFSQDKTDQFVKEFKIDPKYLGKPYLAHSKLGAEGIKNKFNIDDEDILNAVSYHTTGRKGMTQLEKIIFLADCIEPSRSYKGVEEIRRLADLDLNKAVLEAMTRNVEYIRKMGYELDQETLEARAYLLKEIKEKMNG